MERPFTPAPRAADQSAAGIAAASRALTYERAHQKAAAAAALRLRAVCSVTRARRARAAGDRKAAACAMAAALAAQIDATAMERFQ